MERSKRPEAAFLFRGDALTSWPPSQWALPCRDPAAVLPPRFKWCAVPRVLPRLERLRWLPLRDTSVTPRSG